MLIVLYVLCSIPMLLYLKDKIWFFLLENLLKYQKNNCKIYWNTKKIAVKFTVYNSIMAQEWHLPLFYLSLYNEVEGISRKIYIRSN